MPCPDIMRARLKRINWVVQVQVFTYLSHKKEEERECVYMCTYIIKGVQMP